MARRSAPAAPPQRPAHTVAQKRQYIARLERRVAELEALDPTRVTGRFTDPNVVALEAAIDDALSAAFGHGTVEYDRYQRATKLDHGLVMMQLGPGDQHDDVQEARQYVAEGKAGALALLRQATRTLAEEIDDEEAHGTQSASVTAPAASRGLSEVFLVHGHDEGAREAVARFLERLKIRPIILHEQTNQGRTVIEKIEAHGDVGFAIVLLTPDDEGCVRGGQSAPRARQNVLLELGYFIGRLGRKRVCALRRGEVEIPSDFAGVVYESFDAAGGWKTALGRELQEAGFQIDWNSVMRP